MPTSPPSPQLSDGHPSTSSGHWQSSYSQWKPAPLRLGPNADSKQAPDTDMIGQHRPVQHPAGVNAQQHVNAAQDLHKSHADTNSDDDQGPLSRYAPTSPKSPFRFTDLHDTSTSGRGFLDSLTSYSLQAKGTMTPQHVDSSRKPRDGAKAVARRQTSALNWPLSASTKN